MAQYGKMTLGQLQDMRDATAAKKSALDARPAGRNAEVNAGFDKVKVDLQRQIDDIDAEIARRA